LIYIFSVIREKIVIAVESPKLRFKSFSSAIIISICLIAVLLAVPTFSWVNLIVATVLWVITGFGITLVFHRYVTHKAFTVKYEIVRFVMLLAGTLAFQGSVASWVADHRLHHLHSDQPLDPHSPLTPNTGIKGLLWSHIGWLFYSDKEEVRKDRIVATLKEDKLIEFFDRKEVFIGSQVILGLLLFLIGGWSMVVWGIAVRICFVWQITWMINSICHVFGTQTYPESGDSSRNFGWFLLIWLWTLGECWHNNHHYKQTSVNHGALTNAGTDEDPKWVNLNFLLPVLDWQPDPTYWLSLGMKKMRWITIPEKNYILE
jgi:sn-1 stearoyl-lipid 9-desaturase